MKSPRICRTLPAALSTGVVALGAMLPLPGYAADTTQSGGAGSEELEVITVTAQRRTENNQQVPITIAAVSGDALAKQGIFNTTSLGAAVPGLIFTREGDQGTPYIRGIGTTAAGPGSESSVAMYVDGIYQSSQTALLFGLNNVSSIEVLKGPQGTLFGRNASGGVIQITTKDPSFTAGIDLNVGYGNYDTARTSLYATAPLTDTVAINLAMEAEDQTKGWGRDLANNTETFDGYNGNVRSKLLWMPDENTRAMAALDISYNRDETGYGWTLFPGARNIFDVATYDGFYNPDDDPGDVNRWRNEGVSLSLDHNLGWAKVVSTSAERHLLSAGLLNLSVAPVPLFEEVGVYTKGTTFSQEVQLQSLEESKLQWLAGLYYLNDVAALDPDHIYGTALGAGNYENIANTITTNSLAPFGQVTLEVLHGTRLTLGLRYTRDMKEIQGGYTFDGVTILGTAGRQSKIWDKLTWRTAVDHQFTPDVLGYVSYNRGFKSGTFDISSALAPAVAPEVVDAYEAGWKTEWLNHSLRVNGSTFSYKYSNLQLDTVDAASGTERLLNAASAKIYGLDLEAEAVVTSNLRVTAGLEALHARYTNFPSAPAYIPNQPPRGTPPYGGDTLTSANADGLQLLSAPNLSANIAVDYMYSTSGGLFDFNVRPSFTSRYPETFDDRLYQPAVPLLSSSLTWSSADNRWSIRLWGANLLGRQYFTFAGEISSGDVYSPAPPRTFGVVFGMHL
jgi:iron complex outermembrane recepter protein